MMNDKKFEMARDKEKLKKKLKYEDLVEMYYFEALRRQRPVVDRAFEKIVYKVRDRTIEAVKDHLENYPTDEPVSTPEGALVSYFECFLQFILSNNDPDVLFNRINAFIMYIHERLRLSLGEELLGMSNSSLRALNYIDINEPLADQSKIIHDKLQEYEDEDKENNI